MKRIVYLLGFIVIAAFSSCATNNVAPTTTTTTSTTVDPVQLAADDATIKAYLATNKLTATKDTSGLYYQVVTQGSGTNPNSTSYITVSYTGSLLSNGTVIDKETGFGIYLAQVIKGWQIGLPFVRSGGNIILYIPSGLAYGTSSNSTIPANSILIFNINLLNIQ